MCGLSDGQDLAGRVKEVSIGNSNYTKLTPNHTASWPQSLAFKCWPNSKYMHFPIYVLYSFSSHLFFLNTLCTNRNISFDERFVLLIRSAYL